MAGRLCTVSYRDLSGIQHSVQVTAESLYEAGLRGLAAFGAMPMAEDAQPGAATELQIVVQPPEHRVQIRKLLEWLSGGPGRGPKDQILKENLKELLARSSVAVDPSSRLPPR